MITKLHNWFWKSVNAMRTLVVIPARLGSKGLKEKNLLLLDGIPLVEWPIRIALASKHSPRVIVSTEDQRIAEIGLKAGAEVPFLRPKALAEDSVSLVSVSKHALQFFECSEWIPDIVVSMQPTSPFTPLEALDLAIDQVVQHDFNAAVSVKKITGTHPFRAYGLGENKAIKPLTEYTSEKYLQKQDRPEAYGLTGGLYVRRRFLLDRWQGTGFALGEKCYGVLVNEFEGLDIDNELDFLVCETVLKTRKGAGLRGKK